MGVISIGLHYTGLEVSECMGGSYVWCAEFKFTSTPSSMLAAASVTTAANGLLGIATTQRLQLVDSLHHITGIETVSRLGYSCYTYSSSLSR